MGISSNQYGSLLITIIMAKLPDDVRLLQERLLVVFGPLMSYYIQSNSTWKQERQAKQLN